jgi:hypothetical protein
VNDGESAGATGGALAGGVAGGAGAAGVDTGVAGEATAFAPKTAVNPPVCGAVDVVGAGGATGASGAGVGDTGRGATGAAMITVAAVWTSSTGARAGAGAEPNPSSHAAKLVKFGMKCVTITGASSTSKTPNTFDAASSGSARTRSSVVCRSAGVAAASECTITMRPSAISCASSLRAPASDSVFRTRYFVANSALVIDHGERIR